MANFFLIDQSLRDESGHHFDYAQCIARAANEMGFLTTIGTHRRLQTRSEGECASLNHLGSIRRVFHNSTYHKDSYLAGLQKMKRRPTPMNGPTSKEGLLKNFIHRFGFNQHWRRREKRIRQFAMDCDKLFRHTLFTPNDHAFLVAVSELELMGLAVYLSNQPRAIQVQWHLQFHFNLFQGRPPEYESQSSTTKAVRSCFLAALSRLSFHAMNFYTTSEELSEQYNQLGVGNFEPLPYPVAREFSPTTIANYDGSGATILKFANQQAQSINSKYLTKPAVVRPMTQASELGNPLYEFPFESADQRQTDGTRESIPTYSGFERSPILVTCPGGIRSEKGQVDCLQDLVNRIHQPLMATGKIQLQLQRPKRKSWRSEKIDLRIPNDDPLATTQPPIVYLNHPLPRKEYVQLIQSTDVGLLFYDSDAYYSRRAGILGELLAVGKPVIVPAGCWLAEQIAEPIFTHADRQFMDRNVRRCCLSDFAWESTNVPMHGGVMSFDAGRRPFHFECNVEPGENVAGIRFDWHWPQESGIYCRIELTQLDSNSNVVQTNCQTIGHRKQKQPIALFNVASQTRTLRLTLKNAFHHSNASIKNCELLMTRVEHDSIESGLVPVGSVGVIAADREHLDEALIEIVDHIEHYKTTAERFSHRWYAQHDPKRTIAHIIAHESSAAEVA